MRRTARNLAKSIAATVCGARAPRHDPHLVIRPEDMNRFRSWSFFDKRMISSPKILMASGFGYGNIGDEAQLGACISRWKQACPEASVTLLSPNPPYTSALHHERVEWAPRVAWFRSNSTGPYFDDPRFPAFWKRLRRRLEITARCMRGDLPFSLCTPREARILQLIQEHDILHISGGGFLTGKTRSRLWDFCLLMRMCRLLGKPYLLTGHNIGVFQNRDDRTIAIMGLAGALHIGLRDKGISEKELADIGISGPHVLSSCDDALFCDRLPPDEINRLLSAQKIDPTKPWVAVNFHHWGQKEGERSGIEDRFAEICDHIVHVHGFQIVLIAMTPDDVTPEANIARKMKAPAVCFPYSPDYRVVRGIIADSAFVFTMKHHPIVFAQGECVPVVGVALDSYYLHKNKGALENTGDGEFLADNPAFSGEAVLDMIHRVIGENHPIRQRMGIWNTAMREIEMAPYHKAMKAIAAS